MEVLSRKRVFIVAVLLMGTALGALIWKTSIDLLPLPGSLIMDAFDPRKVQVLDRHSRPLTVTYENPWNIHDEVALHDVPALLRQAIVIAEDQRFFGHSGVDWKARLHALLQNAKALGPVRGASTISEQVIRMLHPRPRTLWTRWLEGWEALRLEARFPKGEILEFYMNQVPYAAQRRGVVQAARYYFDRDLDTLSLGEMVALAVMVRAPGRMDLHRGVDEIRRPLERLSRRLLEKGVIHEGQYEQILAEDFQVRTSQLPVQASHFVHYIYGWASLSSLQSRGRLHTTLDSSLQFKAQNLLETRLKDLRGRTVNNGAALVVDHLTDEVLAWVNACNPSDGGLACWIDGVTTPRQPGSTLKPFVYAMALEKGWTAATLLDDLPLAEPVGLGLHAYHNYSRVHYGPIRLRDALGNSLNVPAVRTIQFVGVDDFLRRLKALGVRSLQQHPDHYGDGLALGNGEISLLELVGAYTALARNGVYRPLRCLLHENPSGGSRRRVFSPEVSSLIGDILSDPDARKLEFGTSGLLRFPVQSAVKTGTSSDYRDAWAIGFNHRYTAGVWMGNLDSRAMDGVTGSAGPALVLRALFAELNRHERTRPLYLSPRLVKVEICRDTGRVADGVCHSRSEWFLPGTQPALCADEGKEIKPIQLIQPSDGLEMAMDPRIPDEREAFRFALCGVPEGAKVDWWVDDVPVATTRGGDFLWSLVRGKHVVKAKVYLGDSSSPLEIPTASFRVK